MPDEPQHAVRDGDYRVIYVAGAKGLYKFFPDSAVIAMMKPVDVAGGEKGLMVGYGSLTTFPPAGGVRVLIPTRDTSPGGLWILEVAEPGSSIPTQWVLKNGAAGANPLPTGWSWHRVAASPTSGNVIMMIGSPDGTTQISDNYPSGFITAATTGLSPVWMTTDGGNNWFEVPLPTPFLYSDPSVSHLNDLENGIELTYNNLNTPLIFANVNGIGNFFGVPFKSLAQWWGNPVDLQVRGAAYDGIAPQDANFFAGTGDTAGVQGLVSGLDGDAVLSAAYENSVGGSIAWATADNPNDIPPYTGPTFVGTTHHAIHYLDRLSNPAGAIVGVGTDGIYYSNDYRTEEVSLALAHDDIDGNTFVSTVATLDGVYANGTAGIYHIPDITSPVPVLGIASPVNFLTSSRQSARRIVVGRKPHSDVLDGSLVAKFVIFDGDSWTTIDGPTDVAGNNLHLALRALAVTEG